jgi:hypothetical protein
MGAIVAMVPARPAEMIYRRAHALKIADGRSITVIATIATAGLAEENPPRRYGLRCEL